MVSSYFPRVRTTLRHPDRNIGQEIHQRTGLSAEEGKYGDGTFSITFDLHANDINPAIFITDEGYGLSFDVDIVVGETVYPLTSYALVDHKIFFESEPYVTVSAASIVQHTLERRQMVSKDNAQIVFSATAIGTVISGAISECFVGVATGYTPAYPYAYRNNIAPWTLVVGSFDAGANITIKDESANNLWLYLTNIMERGDYALTFVETALSPGEFTIEGESGYEKEDLADSVVFTGGDSPAVGNGLLAGPPVLLTDFKPLVNTVLGGGQGKGTSQTRVWRTDTPSEAKYGIHEGSGTAHGDNNSLSLANEFDATLRASSSPKQTWEIDILTNEAMVLGRDFGRRSKIGFYHGSMAAFGISAPIEAPIIGWRLSESPSGVPYVSLTLGDLPTNYMAQIQARGGFAGPYLSGGRGVTNAGW